MNIFQRWRVKRKLRKAAGRLIDDAVDAYFDLRKTEIEVSCDVTWKDNYNGFLLHTKQLNKTTISIKTTLLYNDTPSMPKPHNMPCPHVSPKPKH